MKFETYILESGIYQTNFNFIDSCHSRIRIRDKNDGLSLYRLIPNT